MDLVEISLARPKYRRVHRTPTLWTYNGKRVGRFVAILMAVGEKRLYLWVPI